MKLNFLSNKFIYLEMYINTYVSLIGHSNMELTDVDFSQFQKFHWLFENIETDQDYCLTSFVCFKEMNTFFYLHDSCELLR